MVDIIEDDEVWGIDGMGGREIVGLLAGIWGEGGMEPPKCFVSFMWVVKDWRLG
jgi:hypothetical protein